MCEELFLNTFDKPYLYTIYHNLDAICFINLIYYRITCIFVNSKFTIFAAFHEYVRWNPDLKRNIYDVRRYRWVSGVSSSRVTRDVIGYSWVESWTILITPQQFALGHLQLYVHQTNPWMKMLITWQWDIMSLSALQNLSIIYAVNYL